MRKDKIRKITGFLTAGILIGVLVVIAVIASNHTILKSEVIGVRGIGMEVSNNVHNITTTGEITAIQDNEFGKIEKQTLHYHLSDGGTTQIIIEKLSNDDTTKQRAEAIKKGTAGKVFNNDDMSIGEKHTPEHVYTSGVLCVSISEGLNEDEVKEIINVFPKKLNEVKI